MFFPPFLFCFPFDLSLLGPLFAVPEFTSANRNFALQVTMFSAFLVSSKLIASTSIVKNMTRYLMPDETDLRDLTEGVIH